MKKVLLVEDDEIIASQVAKHLEMWQMKTFLINDFQKVVEEFITCRPDIVLMDLKLPAYNGFYWCGEIRKISQIPIVFLSSADDNMNIVMAMNMGADEFVDDNTLTVNVTRIRKKMDAAGVPSFIITKRGMGYIVGEE